MAVIHEHVPPLAGQRRMGYGAAKAALMALCEGLLLRCHGEAFAVRIIKAGFMATPMTGAKLRLPCAPAPSRWRGICCAALFT